MYDLIFDRKTSDVTNNLLKGSYNASDLNRVEEWCKYLADELNTLGYSINITTKTNWTYSGDTGTIRKKSDMTRIKNNILALMNGYHYISTIYSSVDNWNITKANRWEKILYEIYCMMSSMENYYVLSGVGYSGEPRLWQNRLIQTYEGYPKSYEAIPYCQSTGTQYIVLDTYSCNDERIVIDFEFTALGQCYIYGNNYSTHLISVGLDVNNKFTYQYKGTLTTTNTTAVVGTRYVLDLTLKNGTQTLKINGAVVGTSTIADTNRAYSSNKQGLFYKRSSSSSSQLPASIKLYSCRIYNFDVLYQDIVPCKNSDNITCLWEKVYNKLYENAGTGEFLPSEDVGDALLTENGQAITTEVGEAIDFESVPYKLRLDYIESTGQQYIDTGIKASSDLRIQAEFELITILDLYYYLFGGRDGSVSNGFSLRYRTNNWLSEYGDVTTVAYNPARSTYTKYIIDKNRNVCSINGTTITSPTKTFTANQNVAIFGLLHENGLQANPSRLYSFKMYKNDELVRDYIPVLDNNDVACLYDQVTQEFYYNNGFGEFAPSSTSEFTHVDWIESTGTQYINTGIKTNEISRARGIAINTFGLTYGTDTYGGSLFGARVSATNSVYQYGTGAFNDFIGNGTSQVSLTKNTQTTTISISYGKTSYEVACGSYYASGNLNVTITTPLDFYVCGMNNNGALSGGTFKVIAVQLMNNNNEVAMQLIPCIRKSDNKACFYDLVSHQFFENQGTGDFIIPT